MSDAISFSGRLNADPLHALQSQITRLRAKPGCKLMGVVEIERYQINQPDDSDAEPTVLLRISDLEIGKGEQEALLRSAMLALHLHRTAGGTLTEDADIELAQDTLDKLPDLVSVHESARLHAAFEFLVDRVTGLSKNTRHNDGDLRRELKKLADLGVKALAGEQLTIDGTGKPSAKKAPMPAAKDPLDVSGIPDNPRVGEPV